jgi:hypothetical protein
LVSLSFQFLPPPKPPFPDTIKREFHVFGRKRPKLKDELGVETILTATAHSAGSLVSFDGEFWRRMSERSICWDGNGIRYRGIRRKDRFKGGFCAFKSRTGRAIER